MNGINNKLGLITFRPNMTIRLLLTFCIVFYSKDLNLCTCESTTDLIITSFLQSLIREYGTNGTLTYQELKSFLTVDSVVGKSLSNSSSYMAGTNHTCTTLSLDNVSTLPNCKLFECYSLQDVFEFWNLPTSTINETSLQQIAPVILYIMKNKCIKSEESYEKTNKEQHVPPPQVSVWGYGFLMVTVINLCSLVGVIVLPFMKRAAYKQILIFMVALAVGALAGSGLLFLIPEAFGLVDEDHENLSYIFKASTVMCGIYIFYLTEKIMRMATNWKERRNMRQRNLHADLTRDEEDHQRVMEIICSVKKNTPVCQDMMYKETATLPSSVSTCTHQKLMEKSSDDSLYCKDKTSDNKDDSDEAYENTPESAESSRDSLRIIKPLAWMIIFGDGLHNFIDGLSIGTAFTQSTLSGISVSVAVMCEELPHELGDFAILLNCGMSVKKALLYNFLSACMCYLGLIFGILLGENTSSHDWIFAIAGGMFLYISLADMMPEMNSASEAKGSQNTKQIFLIQNFGLISGFGIMFMLAIFGRHINFE